ncbi:MAG TPA: serine hydrolase [Saprospiraceae bacterium]|nr:serine hydrolase [Saprospiraceae bacterium]HMP25283.1 serine hydrolase [Saprospiraceae bacterium]
MKHLLACLSLLFFYLFAPAQAAPEAVGLSAERLQRLDQRILQHVEAGQVPGAVALIARRGQVAHFKGYGAQDIEAGMPMRTDAIFRIASMTKPVTTVAAMMLFEEGKFSLDDRVSKYIPAFAQPQVLIIDATAPAGYRLEAARSPITIRQLLTHTSGIVYGFSGLPFIENLHKEAGISDGLVETEGTLEEWAAKLATQPLAHHPGERFSYGLNTDLLGRLVEIWSGMSLDAFFQQRIFEPLGMADTHFFLPEDKVTRLASVYEPAPDGGLRKTPPIEQRRGAEVYSVSYHYAGPRTFFSGGAGLASTASDYFRFAQMLLNGGALDGVRLLGPKTVELMRSNQIGDLPFWRQGQRIGFGLFVEQGPEHTGQPGSAGTFGWGGFFSTFFRVDPQEEMVAILMTQMHPNNSSIGSDFQVLVYQSIIETNKR